MKINKYIDHTNLKPEATPEDIRRFCKEAIKYGFASVCVNPCYVVLVAKDLQETNVQTCTVIGFPLGATTTETKIFEAKNAIANGATEIDMVINVGAVKAQDFEFVQHEIQAIRNALPQKAILKVIFETCLLTDPEIVQLCHICIEAKADYVKTSTGFNVGGATLEAITLMHDTVHQKIKIKASGGIRSYEKALAMIKAGANRIGTSSSIQIITEQNEHLQQKSGDD